MHCCGCCNKEKIATVNSRFDYKIIRSLDTARVRTIHNKLAQLTRCGPELVPRLALTVHTLHVTAKSLQHAKHRYHYQISALN